MTTPLWILVALAIIPFILAGLGGYHRKQAFGAADNNHPRLQADKLEGKGHRVWAAQANAWEALALFTATIVVATFAGADAAKVASASLLFLAMRVLHPISYIADWATLRSIAATVGLACCVYIFYLSANA